MWLSISSTVNRISETGRYHWRDRFEGRVRIHRRFFEQVMKYVSAAPLECFWTLLLCVRQGLAIELPKDIRVLLYQHLGGRQTIPILRTPRGGLVRRNGLLLYQPVEISLGKPVVCGLRYHFRKKWRRHQSHQEQVKIQFKVPPWLANIIRRLEDCLDANMSQSDPKLVRQSLISLDGQQPVLTAILRCGVASNVHRHTGRGWCSLDSWTMPKTATTFRGPIDSERWRFDKGKPSSEPLSLNVQGMLTTRENGSRHARNIRVLLADLVVVE